MVSSFLLFLEISFPLDYTLLIILIRAMCCGSLEAASLDVDVQAYGILASERRPLPSADFPLAQVSACRYLLHVVDNPAVVVDQNAERHFLLPKSENGA
jgi:hypothetical protein